LLTIFKYEPIDFSINNGKDEDALKFIALIYKPAPGVTEAKDEVFKSYV